MSFEAAAWAIKARTSNATEKLVLIIISDCISGETGIGWPSLDYVAEHAMCSTRTVRRAIRALEKQGLLLVADKPGRSNIYRVLRHAETSSDVQGHAETSDPGQFVRPDTHVRGGGHANRCSPEETPPEPLNQSITSHTTAAEFSPDEKLTQQLKMIGLSYSETDLIEYQIYLDGKIEAGHRINPRKSFMQWLQVQKRRNEMENDNGKSKSRQSGSSGPTAEELLNDFDW